MKKISVVIPAFNASTTLRGTVESCLYQTVRPFEILIIDDGSTDDTFSIARSIQDQAIDNIVIKVLHNDKNMGPSATRNVGWNTAEGEYIAFLDSDDKWHPMKLSRFMRILSANPHIALLGHTNDSKHKKAEVERVPLLSLLIANFAITPNIIVKREIIERFDEKMRYVEDHDLWLRITQKQDAYIFDGSDIPTTLGRKPLSEGGLSGNRYRMRTGEIFMYFKFVSQSVRCAFCTPLVVIIIMAKLIKELAKKFDGEVKCHGLKRDGDT